MRLVSGAPRDRSSWVRCQLEVELRGKLNQPRVVAGRDNASEIARINDLSGGWIDDGGVEVTDVIFEVDTVRQIEEQCPINFSLSDVGYGIPWRLTEVELV